MAKTITVNPKQIEKKAEELKKPVAVNISFGNTYGSHEPYN